MKNKHSITFGNRPTCVNHGCTKLVESSGKRVNGTLKWKVHCARCARASRGVKEHAPGVIPFKIGKCSNTDGHLGWKCFTNLKKLPSFARGTFTDVDHIDGNHTNNSLSNLQELCTNCHRLKSQISGDFAK